MEKEKHIEARYPISASLKEDNFQRLQKLRKKGWKVTKIFLLGITTAEKSK